MAVKLVCKHCGLKGGHNRQRCPELVVPEKCGKGMCSYCMDMSHRREKPLCRGCQEPWGPEVIIHPLPTPGSGIAGFGSS